MSDIMATVKYDYGTELIYVNTKRNKSIAIDTIHISTFVIDHDYLGNNMPVILMNLSLDKAVVDDMILYQNDSIFIFTLYKTNTLATLNLEEECFKKKFVYFLPDTLNPKDSIDYTDASSDETKGATFRNVSIGLICVDHLNYNKKNINAILNNTNMYDAVKYCMSSIPNIVIEPFTYNKTFQQLIIPSIDSLSKAIEYLNRQSVFYNTLYRYYNDFNCTYLISSSGNAILKNGDRYSTVNINIKDLSENESLDEGLIINKTKGIYQMLVNYLDTTVYDRSITNKSKNTLKGMTSTGGAIRTLNNEPSFMTNKISTIRLENDNEGLIDNVASSQRNVFVTLKKENVDSDAFVLNRKYNISHIDKYRDLDGTYLLVRKREFYARADESFGMSITLNFEKIK